MCQKIPIKKLIRKLGRGRSLVLSGQRRENYRQRVNGTERDGKPRARVQAQARAADTWPALGQP